MVVATMAMAAASASADDWGNLATISSTLGVNANRLCLGDGLRASDIGCPSYAPYVTSTGRVGIGTAAQETAGSARQATVCVWITIDPNSHFRRESFATWALALSG